MMESLFILPQSLAKFWNEVLNPAVADIYFARRLGEGFSWQKMEPDFSGEIPLSDVRTTQPLKSFLFPARENVANSPLSGQEPSKTIKSEKIVIGAKACDLNSLPILDFVFKEGDFQDPFYIKLRQSLLIISSDCSTFLDTCFCPLLGSNPYPEKGFDLNLSHIIDGFIVDIGSPKGEALVEEKRDYFKKPSEEQLDERGNNREKLLKELRANIEVKGYLFKKPLKDLVKGKFTSPLWGEIALTCVECGGCNFVCPTCHCFLLSEEKKKKFTRFKNWDACQYPAFARVAGGANPRKRRSERFRNRFDKKFVFFQDILNMYACTGCGRCIEACIGKIDIREVFKKLSK